MLKITQGELAKAAGVSATTVHSFENGETSPSEDTLYRIQKALEDRGIVFINGGNPGVRLMKNPG
jgi:transcriptional regulator with XRE-family HTH domain